MASRLGRAYCRFGLGFQLFRRHLGEKIIFRHADANRYIHLNAAVLGTIKIDMPSLSPTMEKGNIIKWHKKEGDTISPGDVLCEIETDKAVLSMDTEEEGTLAKIIVPDGTKDIAVGQLIALMVEEGDDWTTVEVPADAAAVKPSSAPSSEPTTATSGGSQETEHMHLVGPAVKKLMQEYNIAASSITPTGPAGTLIKGDVLNYIKANNLAKKDQTSPPPAPAAPQTAPPAAAAPPPPAAKAPAASAGAHFVDIPLTSMRRTIAKRLTESKSTIPHAYASIDSDVGAAAALRKSLAEEGVKVSMNDFIIKAAAMALQRVPQVNGVFTNDSPHLSQSADISVAVATPNGLITPIVKGAANLGLVQIGETVKELAGRAREGKLQPHEFQGGSFSVSNLGMFGISEFTAVINLPQMAIMAIGTSRDVATMEGNASRMTVTLSYDSRGISEVEATRFLEEFRHVIENPNTMVAGTHLDAAAEAFAF